MNTCIRLSLALAVGSLLPGCVTTSEFASAPAAEPASPGTDSPRLEDDAAYVAHVERTARRRGITVHWVHKPVKRNIDAKED